MSRPAAPTLHLVDRADPPRRPPRATANEAVLRLRLDQPTLRWHAVHRTRQALAGGMRDLVVWSDCALDVARRVLKPSDLRVTLRPAPDALINPGEPFVHLRVVVQSQVQRERFRRRGWSPEQIVVAPEIVPPADPLDRRELKVEADDFLWLLPCDATRHSGRAAGLSLAVWAAALVHVLERHSARPPRILVPGDHLPQRFARRFIDQLGLERLAVPITWQPLERLAATCDAALLTPTGACDPYGFRLARSFDLPTVALQTPEARETLGDWPLWHRPTDAKARSVAQAMLAVMNAAIPARA
jgi:hypothetical protein